jgi:hypothetical protein
MKGVFRSAEPGSTKYRRSSTCQYLGWGLSDVTPESVIPVHEDGISSLVSLEYLSSNT